MKLSTGGGQGYTDKQGKHYTEMIVPVDNDDEDEGDFWRRFKEQKSKKKKKNVESSLSVLQKRGINYKTLSERSRHYRIGDWNFWPSTGKFHNQKTGVKGRGVFNLIKKL